MMITFHRGSDYFHHKLDRAIITGQKLTKLGTEVVLKEAILHDLSKPGWVGPSNNHKPLPLIYSLTCMSIIIIYRNYNALMKVPV